MTMYKWEIWQLRRKMKDRLARAAGRDRKRLIDAMGCSLDDMLRCPHLFTPAGIAEYAGDRSRTIRYVSVRDDSLRPGEIVVDVRMCRWTWIGLGLWHRHVRRKLARTRDMWCPAGIVAKVVVR